ncbi:MAG: hypothetical protein K0Q68_2160 [Moraxellaceae bacterium]|jgi:hypothetical protein|nr:hypothetical protein [Moraxellaceae bacterium]
MVSISSYKEVIGQGETAVAVHHRPVDGGIINLRMDLKEGTGSSGNWTTPPGGAAKIVLFIQSAAGHDVFVARLSESIPGGGTAGKRWVYQFRDLRQVGASSASWQEFVGKEERRGSTLVHHEPVPETNKAIVIKPLKWNSNGYTQPDGIPATGGFPKDFGYGFEEWINSPASVLRGLRYFHANAEKGGALQAYGEAASLAMVFTGAHKGRQYAIGMAVSISTTSEQERQRVADSTGFRDRSEEVWSLPSVRSIFKEKRTAFDAHWGRNRACYNWKCPDICFVWFEKPVLLDARKISGKEKLISRFGSHQLLHPQHAVEILKKAKCNNAMVKSWLCSGEFDLPRLDAEAMAKANQKLVASRGAGGGNSSANNPYVRVLMGKSQQIDPLHTVLQSAFVEHLQRQPHVRDIREDDEYTDVVFRGESTSWLAEIKPTERVETRYAIRAAVGQLLEYRWRRGGEPRLMIVLSSRPRDEELEFVLSLGMGIAWQLSDGFEVALPGDVHSF